MRQAAPAAGSSDPRAINAAQRNLVLRGDGMKVAGAVNRWDQIYTKTYTSGTGTVDNIQLKNVGLNKRLLIRVTGTITNTATNTPTQTLSTLGAANFFSNVTLTDLSNQVRINCASWLLIGVSSAKYRKVWGSALTSAANVQPFGYGNNWTTGVQTAGATIASGATSNFYLFFEVPISYSDDDLRGAIWAQAINAAWYLQYTVNASLFVGSGADATLAMYQSSTSADLPVLTTFTVTIYQNYLDQLPVVNNTLILPFLDIQTSYMLLTTTLTGLVSGQDFPIPYANFRDFMSTFVIYDNGGTLNTGSDVTYFKLSTANVTNLFQIDPYTATLMSRQRFQADPPKGMYYFDHRNRPINTVQFGNMNLNLNPTGTVNVNAALYVGFEMLAFQSSIQSAQSLPAS